MTHFRQLGDRNRNKISNFFAYFYILNHPSNVVAQLTKMCRPVGCCPVRLSHSCLSLSWFVAQMTVHLNSCSAASVSSILSICPVGLIQTKTALSKPYRQHSTKGFTNIHFAIHFALEYNALHQPYYRSAAITPLYAARYSPAPAHTRLTPAAPARLAP